MTAEINLRFEPVVHVDEALWRQRVIDRIDATAPTSARLTLLNAPAGFGKTTVLAQLARKAAATGRQVAWLNCDERDKDPEMFTGSLGAALARCEFGPADDLAGVNSLTDRMARLQQPLLICVDDYERASAPEVDAIVEQLCLAAPAHVDIILAGRDAPPHLLARLQLSGKARLVDAELLRFTRGEALELLGEAWAEPAAAQVASYADGWAFALQLARLFASNAGDAPAELGAEAAAGLQTKIPRRQIFDYLANEVLARLPPPLQDFLAEVSVLDWVDVESANMLRGHDDSLALIRQLARMRPVVLVDEQQWRVRLHPLLRDYLIDTLELTRPGRVAALHLRAAEYLAEWRADRPWRLHEAVGHAVAGGRLDLGADIIERAGACRLFADEGAVRVRLMMQQLPEATIRRRPRLRLARLIAQTVEGERTSIQAEFERIEQQIRDADSNPRDPARFELEMVRCMTLVDASSRQLRFSPWSVLDQCTQLARTQEPEDERGLAMTLSIELWFFYRYGPVKRCERRIQEMEGLYSHGAYTHNSPWIPTYHARSALAGGDLGKAEHCIRQSLHRDVNFLDLRQGSLHQLVLVLLGEIAYLRGDLEAAREHLAALQAPQMRFLEILHGGHVELAVCEFALGHAGQAMARLQAARQLAFEEGMPQFEALAGAAEIELLARLQDRPAMEAMVERVRLTELWSLAQEPFALPWILVHGLARASFGAWLLRGGLREAAEVAAVLERLARETGYRLGELSALLMKARCADLSGQPAEAQALFAQALVHGQACGVVQVFIDSGAEAMTLLRGWLSAQTDAGSPLVRWAAQLLQVWEQRFRARAQGAVASLLTPREADVLCELARDLPTKMIAKNLLLSPETVKHHLKSIFAKLDVKSREEAVHEARRRALMP